MYFDFDLSNPEYTKLLRHELTRIGSLAKGYGLAVGASTTGLLPPWNLELKGQNHQVS